MSDQTAPAPADEDIAFTQVNNSGAAVYVPVLGRDVAVGETVSYAKPIPGFDRVPDVAAPEADPAPDAPAAPAQDAAPTPSDPSEPASAPTTDPAPAHAAAATHHTHAAPAAAPKE